MPTCFERLPAGAINVCCGRLAVCALAHIRHPRAVSIESAPWACFLRLHARLPSLRNSLNHSTTLAIPAHSSHWSNESGTVPKARLRKSRLTTATCSSSDSVIAPQSHGLTNRCVNALAVSERALKQVNKLVNMSTVKPACGQ